MLEKQLLLEMRDVEILDDPNDYNFCLKKILVKLCGKALLLRLEEFNSPKLIKVNLK